MDHSLTVERETDPDDQKDEKTNEEKIIPPPPKDSLPRGGEKDDSLTEKTIKLYNGFMLTLNPVENIYYQDIVKQKIALNKCNDIIMENKHDDFKIVRHDSNIEIKKNRRVFVDDPNIHGHTYYTFWTFKLPYNTILSRIEKYYHDELSLIGEYHITVGSDDHIKRNYQYIYKDSDINIPWSHTLDEIEYGTLFINEQLEPKVRLYKTKEDDEEKIYMLPIKSEIDRYQSASKILQNIARHYQLVWDVNHKILFNVEEQKDYDLDVIKEILKPIRYMNYYQCLIPYMENILIKKEKREIYFNELHIVYV